MILGIAVLLYIALYFQTACCTYDVSKPESYPLSPFVMSTRQIQIQRLNERFSFNPSVGVLSSDEILFIFRIDLLTRNKTYRNRLGYTVLNESTLETIVAPAYGVLNSVPPVILDRVGDGRLFDFDGFMYIIYCCHDTFALNSVMIVRLVLDSSSNLVALDDSKMILNYPEGNQTIEKNWAPFQYRHQTQEHVTQALLIVHSIVPHRILHHTKPSQAHFIPSQLPTGNGTHTRMHLAFCTTLDKGQLPAFWRTWNTLHCSTPAKIVRVGSSWKYLSFFHTKREFSKHPLSQQLHVSYSFGAYLFEAHPPFAITSMSSLPIVADSFYHGNKSYIFNLDYIVFPGSFYIQNSSIVVLSYGRNDQESWILRMELDGLLSSLISVQSHRCW